MSYILDALKRADAERQRERGGPPDLLTPAVPLGLIESDEPQPAQRWLWPAAALVAGAALAWLAANWWRSEPGKETPPRPAASAPGMANSPVPAPPPAPPPAPAPATLPAPRMAEAPPLPRTRPQAAPATVAVPAAATAPGTLSPAAPGTSPPAAVPPLAAVPAAPLAPPPAQATAAAPARIPKLAELAPALRQGLPPLSVGGSTHSEVATQRLLILNGALLHEGDEVSPGLVLERIRQRSAVLRWQGQRFELDF